MEFDVDQLQITAKEFPNFYKFLLDSSNNSLIFQTRKFTLSVTQTEGI